MSGLRFRLTTAARAYNIRMARLAVATLSDAQLLAECAVDTYRASGPGGQKRNKTSSAVRLRHEPTGLILIAEESRSQHENKAKALRRLRQAFFLKLREPVTPESLALLDSVRGTNAKLHIATAKDPRYWPIVGVLLDVLDATSAQVSEAAKLLGTTTANLLGVLEVDDKAWGEANALRRKFGQKPLRLGD
jgi:RF-1 domain